MFTDRAVEQWLELWLDTHLAQQQQSNVVILTGVTVVGAL